VKIVVISDTHGNYPAALRAVELIEGVHAIIHLGDCCDDALPLQTALSRTVIRVPGNCDVGSPLPRELLIRLGAIPFLLCHGDAYGVKGGLSRLAEHATWIGAEVVLFGHTHMPLVHNHGRMLFVNPGALQKGNPSPTFALVTLNHGTATARIISLPAAPAP
jgi:putative phosphoesterase